MKTLILFATFLLFVLVFTSVAAQGQKLTIQTDSVKQVVLNRADLEAFPHVKVTSSEHSSGSVSFERGTLNSVLDKVGVTFGESMKGKRLTNCPLVEAADGHRAVIALPELDPRRSPINGVCWFSCGMGNPQRDRGSYRIVIRDESEWPAGSGR